MLSDANRLEEILKTLTTDQLKFVAIRPTVRFDHEAAAAIGLHRTSVARWDNKSDIDEAVRLMLLDGVMVAREILRRSLSKAAAEIVDELDHKGVNIRHMAAVEILDRVMGKPTQKQEISGVGNKPIALEVKGVDYRAAIANLAPRSMGDSPASGEGEDAFNGS